MSAELLTQNHHRRLMMDKIELYRDGSGGHCLLEVVSAPFSASFSFYFDNPPFTEFVRCLETIHRTLAGEARLGNNHEDPYISFRGDGRGHITVSGLLVVYDEHSQKLAFSFESDQTSLPSFISDLRKVFESPAA